MAFSIRGAFLFSVICFLTFLFLVPACCYGFSENRKSISKSESVIEKEKVKTFIEKTKQPDKEYEAFMKKLIGKFFTGTGLKIIVAICVFLCLFFFFKARNYLVAIVFYIIGVLLTFFGPYIAKALLK